MTLILINCYSVKLSARVMSVLSVTKLLAVAFIVVVGVIFMITRKGNFPDGFTRSFDPIDGKQPSVFTVGLSLYGVLFAYDGWYVRRNNNTVELPNNNIQSKKLKENCIIVWNDYIRVLLRIY